MKITVLQNIDRDRQYGKHIEVGDKTYDVRVYYDLGGMNYFSGRTEPRGIYLGVTPVKRGNGFKSFMGWSGIKVLIKPLERYNAKKFKEIALPFVNLLDVDPHPDVIRVLEAVIEKNKGKEVA